MMQRSQGDAMRRMFARGAWPYPATRFEWVGHGGRLRCVDCGASGYGAKYPDETTAAPWQISHMADHRYPCICGLTFLAPWHLAQHILPTRWPERIVEHQPVCPHGAGLMDCPVCNPTDEASPVVPDASSAG